MWEASGGAWGISEAAISRQAHAGGHLESLADRLTGGSLASLITHLVEEKRMPREEIAVKERYRAVSSELGAAVAAGEITEEEAKARWEAFEEEAAANAR